MHIDKLKENWDALGEDDAYWAVLSDPSKINNGWELTEFYKTGIQTIRALQRHVKDAGIKYGKVLDFGCGPGRLTQALAMRSSSVVGVDISDSMISKARAYNKFPEKVRYQVNEKPSLADFESNSFHLVFSLITLQHIEPQYSTAYIKEFVRVCKPGGHILFNLPTEPPHFFKVLKTLVGHSGINLIRKIYYRKSSVIEMHPVSEDAVLNIAKENGAEVVKVFPDTKIGMGWKSNYYLFQKRMASL